MHYFKNIVYHLLNTFLEMNTSYYSFANMKINREGNIEDIKFQRSTCARTIS